MSSYFYGNINGKEYHDAKEFEKDYVGYMNDYQKYINEFWHNLLSPVGYLFGDAAEEAERDLEEYDECGYRFIPKIIKVVYNDPVTVVMFEDGDKVIVKCHDEDTFTKEAGFVFALIRKLNINHWLKKAKNEFGDKSELELAKLTLESYIGESRLASLIKKNCK